MENFGHFTSNGYMITERDIPRHWYNYLYNDEYITFVSHVGFGQGFAQDKIGNRVFPVTDRNVFISDGENFWQATGLPVHSDFDEYYCEHCIGYTDICVVKNKIKSTLRFFVPTKGKREFLKVTVENIGNCKKTIKVIPFADTTIDGAYTPQGYQTSIGRYYDEFNGVAGAGYPSFDGTQEKSYAYLTCDRKVSSFDTRRNEFIGTYDNKLNPKAMRQNLGCKGTDCIGEKICFALENTITLNAGDTETLYYTFGFEKHIEEIPVFNGDEIENQFTEMLNAYSDICSGISIETPWDNLNNLFNDWLKYQTNMGSRWARVRHNGMRDLTSDTECLSCFDAKLAVERLCRIMTYHYSNGYCPRTFIDGQIKDNNFSDNMVWMVFAIYAVTKELGDISFLSRDVPFNDGTVASVYEHASRIIEFMYDFTGHHELVRIWGGDWNDCMNNAGIKGKGVSVWLSIAFVRAAKMLAEMASWIGNDNDSKRYLAFAATMQERVNKYGWKGDRYIYAISDDGHLIGDASSKEASMFALPQLWSVLAGFEEDKAQIAMQTLEDILNTNLGLLVSTPAFTKDVPYIGTMTWKYPGIHENGGAYLHAATWKLAVDSILGRADKVEEGLRKILPNDNTYFKTMGEPYVMCNSYFGLETGYRAGTPGQSWRTATGQWLLYALVRFVYGLIPEFDGLVIKPCLPLSWSECSITKVFRGCTYNVHFHGNGKVHSIIVNGESHIIEAPIKPVKGEILTIHVNLK